jgi:hypothetical protein
LTSHSHHSFYTYTHSHTHTDTHKYIYLHTHTYRTVPDPRALKILGEFSPLVEIGAGNG